MEEWKLAKENFSFLSVPVRGNFSISGNPPLVKEDDHILTSLKNPQEKGCSLAVKSLPSTVCISLQFLTDEERILSLTMHNARF